MALRYPKSWLSDAEKELANQIRAGRKIMAAKGKDVRTDQSDEELLAELKVARLKEIHPEYKKLRAREIKEGAEIRQKKGNQ